METTKTTRRESLGMPLQAAPINRTEPGAKLANGSGVEASWGWGDVWNVAKKVGGALLS